MFIRKFAIVALHILFWLVITALPQYWIFTASEAKEIPQEVIIYTIITFLYHIVSFYTFYFFVVPYSFEKKHKLFYSVSIFFIVATLLFTTKTTIIWVLGKILNLDFASHHLFSYKQQISEAFNTAFFILIAILLRIAIYWFNSQKKSTELAIKEQQLELELLKAQINPHFFFNTLNNIYSLVYKKSDHAPAAVMKLSEIMRYMIYESKAAMVPLEKEVEQLGNYIELERLRTRNPDFVSFEIRGNTDMHLIPPMLLLTFAENAFKHGRRQVINPGIEFRIIADEERLFYSVKNYILKEPQNNHRGEGIGLQNTRRRLELLYPKCHKLEISSDKEKHEVKLELKCRNIKNGKR